MRENKIHNLYVDKLLKLIINNDFEKFKELLSKPPFANLETTDNNACSSPEVKTDQNSINFLVRKSTRESCLHVAARLGHIKILRFCLEKANGNIELCDTDGKTPLHEASQFSQLEIVEYLISKGANVNVVKKADWTPLMLACTKNNVEIVKCLLSASADPFFKNKDGWNSLHLAARVGNLEIVQSLISCAQNNAQILCNTASKNGRTPLHTAVMHGHQLVAKCLLETFDNVNCVDSCGTSPIMDALRFGFVEIAEFLTNKEIGGKIDGSNNIGMNCLHISAEAGKLESVSFILKNYQNIIGINSQTPGQGLTALHYTVRENHLDCLKLLVELGSDTTIKDGKGDTCIDYAVRLKRESIVNYFNSLSLTSK